MGNNMNIKQTIKDWFGNGEIDVNLMIRCGAISEDQIIEIFINDVFGPGYTSEQPCIKSA